MSAPPVSPNEILDPVENLIENNVYSVKMFDEDTGRYKAIGDEYLPYMLKTKGDKFKFERIDRGHTFNIHKDDINKYTFFKLGQEALRPPARPPARPPGLLGGRRRTLRKSCNMRRAITKILSRKCRLKNFKSRRFRKH